MAYITFYNFLKRLNSESKNKPGKSNNNEDDKNFSKFNDQVWRMIGSFLALLLKQLQDIETMSKTIDLKSLLVPKSILTENNCMIRVN